MMKPKAKIRAPRRVRSRMVQPARPHSDRPFLFRASPAAPSVRDVLPFAVHPGQHELERAYRALQKHFDTYAEVYAKKDQPVRRGTKKAELRDWVISTGNRLSGAAFSAFRAVVEPLDISQHWSTTPIEQDLIHPNRAILFAMATGRVRRIQAVIPIPVGSAAKTLQKAIYEGGPLPLIRRVLGRPLLHEEGIALSASERRAKVRVGEGLQEATGLLAASGLLQGAGILRATHSKDNYRISLCDAVITSESIGLSDMVRALWSFDAEHEENWVCPPDPDLFGEGPSIFIQAVGFSEDPDGSDLVAAPWMSRFPVLFGPDPDCADDGSKPQETGRRLAWVRASFQGHLVLEGLDFGNRRVLAEVNAAMREERETRMQDVQDQLSRQREGYHYAWGESRFRASTTPQYAGRDLLPWEDPGETDVSFPTLREVGEKDAPTYGETRRLVPWRAY